MRHLGGGDRGLVALLVFKFFPAIERKLLWLLQLRLLQELIVTQRMPQEPYKPLETALPVVATTCASRKLRPGSAG